MAPRMPPDANSSWTGTRSPQPGWSCPARWPRRRWSLPIRALGRPTHTTENRSAASRRQYTSRSLSAEKAQGLARSSRACANATTCHANVAATTQPRRRFHDDKERLHRRRMGSGSAGSVCGWDGDLHGRPWRSHRDGQRVDGDSEVGDESAQPRAAAHRHRLGPPVDDAAATEPAQGLQAAGT